MTTLYNVENVLAKPSAKEVFTIFDFETTGLDHNENQIVEVAAIRTDLTQELGRLHMLVALEEGKKLPDFLIDNTDLRDHMLVNGVTELHMMIVLSAFIGNSTVVAHYFPFDSAYLANYQIHPESFLCTRSIERFLNPKESASLDPTAKRRGVKLEGAHRAMNDIEATIGVLKSQLQELKDRGIPRSRVSNMIVDSEERPNRFSPLMAKVVTKKETDQVGRRVKIRDKQHISYGEKGRVVEAYRSAVQKENKKTGIEANEGHRVLVVMLDSGEQIVINEEQVKYNGGQR